EKPYEPSPAASAAGFNGEESGDGKGAIKGFGSVWWRVLFEYDCLVSVGQDAVFQVHADGLGQGYFFLVATLADQVFDTVPVGEPHHALIDDGAFVQLFGHVVAGGADHLDPSGIGLVIGLAPNEGGQKGVMDVDDSVRIGLHEAGTQDLH